MNPNIEGLNKSPRPPLPTFLSVWEAPMASYIPLLAYLIV